MKTLRNQIESIIRINFGGRYFKTTDTTYLFSDNQICEVVDDIMALPKTGLIDENKKLQSELKQKDKKIQELIDHIKLIEGLRR